MSAAFITESGSVIACVNFTIVDDDNYEGDHNFTVRLVEGSQSLSSLVIGGDSEVMFTIIDKDGELVLS